MAGVVLLPLLYFYFPALGTGSTDRHDYDQISGIWIQIVNMHNEKVPEEEWKKFSAVAKEKVAQQRQTLEGRSQTEMVKMLTEIHEKCLPPILTGTEAERSAAVDQMREQMMRGVKILGSE